MWRRLGHGLVCLGVGLVLTALLGSVVAIPVVALLIERRP